MIRLLGAITGAALALAALLVLIGVPQFKATPAEPQREVVTLPVRAEPSGPAIESIDLPEPVDELIAAIAADIAEPAEQDPMAQQPVPAAFELPEIADAGQWYAFWSPFRSEIAATGFVEQLQRVTGLDYRVVKIEPGVYEVAFAYADDEDIPLNLSQISAATGLEMPGS